MSTANIIERAKPEDKSKMNLALEKRFYYIRVRDIKSIHPNLIRGKDQSAAQFQITFSFAEKKSQSFFQSRYGNLTDKCLKKLKEQCHFFGFQGEEVLIVQISQVGNTKIKAFASIYLAPFYTLPDVCHSITVKMIFRQSDNKIIKDLSAKLSMDLYFLKDLNAKLQLTPIEAKITRNTINLGLMRPYLRFDVNQQVQKTSIIREGAGINPNWQEYAETEENFKQAESVSQMDNCFQFELCTVNHELKIQLLNHPLIGEDPILIGSSIIDLQNSECFLRPNELFTCSEKNSIKLKYHDSETDEEQSAGELFLKIKLIYNIKKIRKELDSDESSDDDDASKRI